MAAPSFSPATYERRLHALRQGMEEAGVDLAVVGPSAEVRYLLGYRAFALDRVTVLLVSTSGAAMVLPDFDLPEFVSETGFENALGWSDMGGPGRALKEALSRLALPAKPRIALDDWLPFYAEFALREHLSTGEAIQLSDLTAPLRIIKSEEERELMRKAGEVVARGVDAAQAAAEPGMTEKELLRVIEAALWAAGSDDVDFVTAQGGAHAASPHHQAGDYVLQRGESVLYDIAVRTNGYYADTTQQVFLGPPSAEYHRAYDTLREAQAAGVDAAQAGGRLGDVAVAANEILDAAGYREVRSARVGHGIGLDVHEAPSVRSSNDLTLRPGMTFTVEPGIYVPGAFGIRIEDTVLVQESGPEVLTRASRPLVIKDV